MPEAVNRPKLSILACGGGSRGILSLGYLKAWKESGLEYDAIYAGSVGALNAMLFVQDQMDELETLWLTIQNRDVYKSRILSLWKLWTDDASLYDSTPLEAVIRKYLDMVKIKAFPKPFIVNATNLSNMRTEAKDIRNLTFEEAVKWILASASPPILFPTITINGCQYCDTGILNNYFILQAVNDGYDTLVCMTPTNYKIKPIQNLIDEIQATISTASFGYLDRETEAVNELNRELTANGDLDKLIKLVVIRPPYAWDQELINFNYKEDRASLIEYGYNIAKEALKGLSQ